MFPLLLSTLFSASFGLVVRYAQGRRCNMWAVGAINYVFAALFHLTRSFLGGSHVPSASTLWIGIVGGIVYVVSYFLLFPFMKLRGVSISTAVMRLAVLIPVGVSILVWGEQPTTPQTLGVLLALVSLPLLGLRGQSGGVRLPGRALALLVALFIGNGLGMVVVRGFNQTGVVGEDALFLATLFSTAALIGVVIWWAQVWQERRRTATAPEPADCSPSGLPQALLPGAALGLVNALANLMLVAALDRLPAVLVFPFYSAVGLMFAVLFARLVWREQITRRELVGMGVALFAVVFINVA